MGETLLELAKVFVQYSKELMLFTSQAEVTMIQQAFRYACNTLDMIAQASACCYGTERPQYLSHHLRQSLIFSVARRD